MLIGAGVRNGGGPMRQLGAPLAAAVERNTWAQAGALRNLWAGEATVVAGAPIANRSSVPNGCLHPASWLMAPKPGGMASRGATAITISATGSVSRGLPVEGSANIAISAAGAATAVGAVAGSAAIALAAAGEAYGQATVSGSAAISLAAAGTIGAIAYVQGSASVSITAAATMGCTARVAGDAYLSAAAEGATLTEAGIATATVAALQATTIPVDLQRVRGQALDGTGTSGDPWGPA